MILVTAWNAFMAWSQNSEILAAYALAGGFATPLLLSTGGNHEIFLFTYILAIDIATVVLLRLKPWPRLAAGSISSDGRLLHRLVHLPSIRPTSLESTALFVALFFAVFVSVPIGWKESNQPGQSETRGALRITEIFLPLANAHLCVACALLAACRTQAITICCRG